MPDAIQPSATFHLSGSEPPLADVPDQVKTQKGSGHPLEQQEIAMRGSVPEKPNGGFQAWTVVCAAFLVMAHSPGMHYIFSVMFVAFIDEFQASRTAVAWCGSISTAMVFSCSYLSGYLQARTSQRTVVLVGGALASLGLLLCSLAGALWHLYIAFGLVVGLGHALNFPPCPVMVHKWFSSRAAVATALATSGSGAGTVYLGTLCSALFRSLGWRPTFRILALVSFVANTTAALAFRDPPAQAPASRRASEHATAAKLTVPAAWPPPCLPPGPASHRPGPPSPGGAPRCKEGGEGPPGAGHPSLQAPPAGGGEAARVGCATAGIGSMQGTCPLLAAATTAPRKGPVPFSALTSNRRMRVLCGCALLVSLVWETPIVHLTQYALDAGIPAARADRLVVGIGVGGLVGRVVVMRTVDPREPERTFTRVLAALGTAHLLLPSMVHVFPMAMLYAVVLGTCIGSLVALTVPLVATIVGVEAIPQASGLYFTTLSLGILFGPPLAGALCTATGGYSTPFVLIGTLSWLASLMSLQLSQRSFFTEKMHKFWSTTSAV